MTESIQKIMSLPPVMGRSLGRYRLSTRGGAGDGQKNEGQKNVAYAVCLHFYAPHLFASVVICC